MVDSDANFVLFGEFGDQARDLAGACSTAACWCATSGSPGWLRVTAGTEAETTAFLDALRKVCRTS